MFTLEFMGCRVENVCANVYRAYIPGKEWENLVICFTADGVKSGGRYGAHFRITTVTKNNRCYRSPRYHYKYMILVREFAFELLKQGRLWDYVNQCPAANPLDC